ncbi:hypothetical protein BLS_010144 [Venturia inaequalis]|uniref:Uncharacterized protein n=1 Tax=Venturia inaequalis TaxID=5025 RepID=A0A8H3VL38_VENIN|nr:hypothetical protein BLS_010144 [Venturia inaequalis]KAE9988693.1 hypothetical protein EG328_008710 [Venturia inaequalis]KAE9989437.1 hypothetical protein EG327_002670 [Venturia inaequalis]RDI83063.1 hypothetical protein Vi05172_g6954 [Venturia inaequalis]
MRFLIATVCAIASTLVAAAPVTDLKETALAIRDSDPFTSRAIICPPGSNGHCDQIIHTIPQMNISAANNALAMCQAFEQNQHGDNEPPHATSTGFDPKTATIMVCSDPYYTGPCDHPTITHGVCKQMTVGSLVGGPPLAGTPQGMSSMWLGDKVEHCILSCGLNCEDISQVGGFEDWGNIEDMTIGLLKPLDNMILSYKCFMV